MPSLDNYGLMKPEMKEYFEANKYFTEAAFDDIAAGKHEPKKDVDFKVWTSAGEVPKVVANDFDQCREALLNPKTYKGIFGFDDDEEDSNCIAVCTTGPLRCEDDDDCDLVYTFSEALRMKDDTEPLTQDQILSRLSNPNILRNMDHFKKLPKGLQLYMQQFPYFKEQLRLGNLETSPPSPDQIVDDEASSVSKFSYASSDKENTSSMAIPSASMSSSNPLSESSNKTGVDRTLRPLPSRSSGIQAKKSALNDETPKTTKWKPAPGPGHDLKVNRRMESFKKNFSTQKRRRDSSSPSENSTQ